LKTSLFFSTAPQPTEENPRRSWLSRGDLLASVAQLAIVRLARSKRSSVSVEMAAVAIPFFMLMLGSFEVSYDSYMQSAMNFAVSEGARQIWLGKAQGSMSSANFVNGFVCPAVGFMVDCSLLTMRVQPVRPVTSNDFWQFMTNASPGPLPYYSTGTGRSATLTTATWAVCTGAPGEGVLVEAVYAGPTFVGGFIPSFVVNTASGLVHPTYAAQGFVSQTNFTTTATC
jgi:Flp pilus assembly protein TadG